MSAQAMSLEDFEKNAMDFYVISENFSQEGIADSIRGFFSNTKAFITKHFFSDEDLTQFLNENKYLALAESDAYRDIYRKKVPVPTGLKSSFIKYIEALNQIQDMADTLMVDVLGPFQVYLGQLLNNPADLASHRQAKILGPMIKRDLDKAKDNLKKHFSGNNEYQEYGKLIGNQAQWREIVKRYNDLIERTHRLSPRKVQESVDTVVDYLDTLAMRIKEDQDSYQLSDMALKDFAKLNYAVAAEVEFYANYLYSIRILTNSIEYAGDIVRGARK